MRENVVFDAEGALLHAWFYPANRVAGGNPCVVMAHGWTSTKKMYLDKFAEIFAHAGLSDWYSTIVVGVNLAPRLADLGTRWIHGNRSGTISMQSPTPRIGSELTRIESESGVRVSRQRMPSSSLRSIDVSRQSARRLRSLAAE